MKIDGEAIRQLRGHTGARYFAASVAALAADYVLTLVLFHLARLDLSIAAAISFFSVGAAFYLVHEFWTFRKETSGFSPVRMAGNLVILCAAGAVRIGLISALEQARTPEGVWISLYFAIGVAGSFTTNYVLNRYLVFRR